MYIEKILFLVEIKGIIWSLISTWPLCPICLFYSIPSHVPFSLKAKIISTSVLLYLLWHFYPSVSYCCHSYNISLPLSITQCLITALCFKCYHSLPSHIFMFVCEIDMLFTHTWFWLLLFWLLLVTHTWFCSFLLIIKF